MTLIFKNGIEIGETQCFHRILNKDKFRYRLSTDILGMESGWSHEFATETEAALTCEIHAQHLFELLRKAFTRS